MHISKSNNGGHFSNQPENAGDQHQVLRNTNIQRDEGVIVAVLVTHSNIVGVVVVIDADFPQSHKGHTRVRDHTFLQVPHSPLWEAHGGDAKNPCYGGQSKTSYLETEILLERFYGSEHPTTAKKYKTT